MTEIYHMPGHLVRRIHQISTSLFQERMKDLGLDLTAVQYAALAVLAENPGVDQATLAGLIAYDRVTIGGVLDRLEQKGFLRREVNENDRRAKVLRLRDEGRKVLEQTGPVVRAMQDDILTGLSSEQRLVFIDLAQRIAEAGNNQSRAPLIPRRSEP